MYVFCDSYTSVIGHGKHYLTINYWHASHSMVSLNVDEIKKKKLEHTCLINNRFFFFFF